jgi:hypothetical protein
VRARLRVRGRGTDMEVLERYFGLGRLGRYDAA